MTGAAASAISTETAPTPEGKAVVDSPSELGRAPIPPRATLRELKVFFPFPVREIVQRAPELSDKISPGSAFDKQPKTKSGRACPITCRAVTGLGFSALTTKPDCDTTYILDNEAALLGTSGHIAALIP